jgi:DNA processing protein
MPPERGYLWGELPPEPWVSIVGTRAPSKQGFRDAFFLARRLARLGVTVASGGALGIDSAAHMGALAGKGRTVVVAPTWLPWAYPIKNHRLFKRILESQGGYLSFAEPRAKPLKFAFFRRNEALMAMSQAAVLGECPPKSGARNAMLHARTLERTRFALPHRFLDKRSRGTWMEIVVHGAELVADEKPIVTLLRQCGTLKNEGAPSLELPELPPEQADVVKAVRCGSGTVDEICEKTGMAPEVVQHVVLLLTLSGTVREDQRGLLVL